MVAKIEKIFKRGAKKVQGHCVTEFVPLHDIPYILLSPNGGPYFSIDEFLASPDRYPDPSTFVPDVSHV